VIGDHDLDIAAAHLAAEILDREREAVARLLAQPRRRTGQRHDHADLDLVLRHRRVANEPEQDRQSGQSQLLFHDLSPDRPLQPRSTPTRSGPSGRQLILMTALAASKAATAEVETCKPRANYLNPKATGKPQ